MASANGEQDPLNASVFLKSLQDIHPNVAGILSLKQLNCLDTNIWQPLGSIYDEKSPIDRKDQEFYDFTEAYFEASLWVLFGTWALPSKLKEPRPASTDKKIDVVDYNGVTKVLTMVRDRLWTIMKKKLETTEEILGEMGLPRVIKLCRKLKLSEKEMKVLLFTMYSQGCTTFSLNFKSDDGFDYDRVRFFNSKFPLELAKLCDMNIEEIISFGTNYPELKHKRFLGLRSEYYLRNENFLLRKLSSGGLLGRKLTSKELLDLEGTGLDEIIKEEIGVDTSTDTEVAEKAAAQPLPADETIGKDEANRITKLESNEDIKMDLTELFESERMKEKEMRELAPPTDTTGVEEVTSTMATDDQTITPYKTDLEYIEDHLEHIDWLIERRKIDAMDDQMLWVY